MPVSKTIAYDFKEVDDDLYINPITGDFDFVPSDNNHIRDILASFPGWYKEFPQLGAGMPVLLKGKINLQKVEAVIKQQLEADGYQFLKRPIINQTNGRIKIIISNVIRINI